MDPRRTAFFTASHAPADYPDHANDYYDDDEGSDDWERIQRVPRISNYENYVYLALVLTAALCLLTLVLLFVFFRMRRHKEDRGGGGGGAGYESRGRSWSRIFERDGHHAHGNPSGKHQGTSFFANYGRSMPLLPTTASQCNLTDDSLSCTNLSAGLTGFPELPAKVTFTRHHKNRMNHELSFAIASAKSKVNLAEIHESLSREGALPLPEDEDSPYVDHPYEVVVDIQTPL